MKKDANVHLERFLAISRAIAGQLDYQSVLLKISDEINHLIPHDHMDVAIVSPDKRDTQVVYEVGMTTEWGNSERKKHGVTESPIRDLLQGKVQYYLTDDAWNDPRFHFQNAFDAPIFSANLRSRMHVAMQVHGIVQGTLNISSHEKGRYNQDDLHTAQQLADLLAPYFYALIHGEQAKELASAEGAARGREEALRLGALRLTEGMENARKQIGMDLHDQTLADLTRISRRISAMGRRASTPPRDIAKLGNEISTCMNELRRIIEDTKPGVMELFGFAQAVEAQLERSVAGVTPKIRTQVNDEASHLLDQSPESLRTTLFRIVQEAINNAVKHGEPETVTVRISTDGKSLKISVEDDGNGSVPNPDHFTGGLGNMKVRAALISSRIEIKNPANKRGTCVSIFTPFSEMQAEEENATGEHLLTKGMA